MADNKVHIVKVGAAWCQPCVVMDKYFDKVVSSFGEAVTAEKIDTSEEVDKASKLNVTAIPALVFFKNGTEVTRSIGVLSESNLTKKIQGILDDEVEPRKG